jgi:hypothetical protein
MDTRPIKLMEIDYGVSTHIKLHAEQCRLANELIHHTSDVATSKRAFSISSNSKSVHKELRVKQLKQLLNSKKISQCEKLIAQKELAKLIKEK